jgi:solute:Na+ symporter, SSS family
VFAIILLSVFLLAMIGIGIWGMRRTSTLNDFFLGGRSIGPWVSAIAYGTTYFSAVLFIGFAGKLGWGFGLGALWIAAGNVVLGSFLAWWVLGRRTRRMTQNLDVMTMPEFLAERYGAKSLKLIAAAIIFIFLLPYSASIFKGLGHLFEINFKMSYDLALLLMIAVTGVYLVLGGYFSVAVTDFIQGIIMVFGSLAMVAVLVGKGGGLGTVVHQIVAVYPQHVPLAKQPSFWTLASLVFMTSFGTWGMPQMVQKFYAIKDESVIKVAAVITSLFAVVIVFSAYFTGAMTHIFYSAVPLVNGQPGFDRLIPGLLTTHLSPELMALILLLVLSASMSTLSSLVLVSSSAVAIDMYKGHVNPGVSSANSVAMMRFLSGLFILISFLIARYEFAFIVTLMSLSWGAVAGSFMAPYVYGLFWKRVTAAGAYAGMATGLLTSVGLFFLLGPAQAPLSASLAMILPFAVVPAVSWFTQPPSAEIMQKAFERI